MAYTDVLNPTTDSPYNFWYPVSFDRGNPDLEQNLLSSIKTREQGVPYHIFAVTWTRLDQATADYIDQWHERFKNGLFTVNLWQNGRQLTGRFTARPQRVWNQAIKGYTMTATFKEFPGAPMLSYPGGSTLWGIYGALDEEIDWQGLPTWDLTGSWALVSDSHYSGGQCYRSNVLNDAAVYEYGGYGFQYFAAKGPNMGQAQISLDGTVLTTIDFYAAALQAASAVYTYENVSIGRHRITVTVLHTKNASASDYYVPVDGLVRMT